MLRRTAVVVTVLLVIGVTIQLVPYGRHHSNPPVTAEPVWDSPQTRALAVKACFDCHSNETHWPWYSHVAPMSWLVQRDVDAGRHELNFSEWQLGYEEAAEAGQKVLDGEMPPAAYVSLHGEASLSPDETRALSRGLDETVGAVRRDHGRH